MGVEQLQNEITTVLNRLKRPKKAVVTAGMPYANGPVHLGHLAGAHIPADIYARWMRLLIGKDNVLFVCGTDDHGSTSEISAKKANIPIKEFISSVHSAQSKTMDKYNISLDIYSGTSQEDNLEEHRELCQSTLRKLHKNKMLDKRTSQQWFDTKNNLFLPDRYVHGTCPKCDSPGAYSEECDSCGAQYESNQLVNPVSSVSDSTPILKDTDHWYLNMWKVVDQLREWLESKKKTWRKDILLEVMNNVHPSVIFPNSFEDQYKEIKESLPKHKSRYAPGKKVVVQFNSLTDLKTGREILMDNKIESELLDDWAHRSITRDVAWGIPVPQDVDKDMNSKTLYVWPESLIAPISFCKAALKSQGKDVNEYKKFWEDPEAKIYQFLGQDNVFFYVLMQAAMWFGTQQDPFRMPIENETQLTEIFSNYHLQIDGKKMSKSKGNFYTGDQLIDELGYSGDQVRYFLALLSLAEKNSNFDMETFKQRNQFLSGPLNAAFEKPISAVHSKYNSKIPNGELIGKTEKETKKIVQHYIKMMEKAEYSKALFAIENYARIINGLFAQFKPHDDRHDEKERADALYSSFYILKNLLIMLSPFAPETMEKLRGTLNLPQEVYSIDQLGKPMPEEHHIREQVEYFPAT